MERIVLLSLHWSICKKNYSLLFHKTHYHLGAQQKHFLKM